MKIAVLSDLHVGIEAKSQDLCPRTLVTRREKARFDAKQKDYIDAFVRFLKKEKISADYLLVPGDVTDKGCPAAVKVASDFLEKVRKVLHVQKRHLLFVPGNHDADWDMYDPKDPDLIKWNYRYAAFQSSKYVFAKINQQGKGDLLNNHFFKLWRFKDLLVLGYNSSSTDMPRNKTHAGEIVIQHLKRMEDCLGKCAFGNKLRICLLHHHLKKYALPKESERDSSAADNAVEFLNLLDKYHFDLIIHGHQHHSFLDGNLGSVPILCAGSFSAEVSSAWEGVVSNQFHLVEINAKRDGKHACGVVKSWSNTINGWIESEEKKGLHIIGHTRGFGMSIKNPSVELRIRKELSSFVRRNRTFLLRRDVMRHLPELQYLIESKEDVIAWCKENIMDGRKWDIFTRREDNDVVFMRKGKVR